jgi:hypothetical protein
MKRKMTVALLVSVLALVAVVFLIGLLLPKQRAFVKEADLKSPPEQVFQTVTDVGLQAAWRSDVKEIKVINQNTWTEIPKKGTPITFRTKQKVENRIFEIEIVAPENIKGYWVGTFEARATGTKVVFKEVVTIENPFFRVFGWLFVDLDKTMKLYMDNLKTKLGE